MRSRRRRRVEEFDYAIRGIVRTTQGIFRLAGRDDLARRFRPVFHRVLRKLDEAKKKEQEQEQAQADADAPADTEGAETAPTGEAAAPAETTA